MKKIHFLPDNKPKRKCDKRQEENLAKMKQIKLTKFKSNIKIHTQYIQHFERTNKDVESTLSESKH